MERTTTRSAAEVLETLRSLDKRSRAFAWNVKCHRGPDELSAEDFAELRSELGLEGKELPPRPGAAPLPFGAEWIRERFEEGTSPDYYEGPEDFARSQAWEDADAFARELLDSILPGKVELQSDGRSGGWAVLAGVDAADVVHAAEDFARLEELRDRLGRLRAVLHFEERGELQRAARLAREHGLPGDKWRELRATLEDELLQHAEEETSGDYAERLRASVELRRFAEERASYPGPIRGDSDYEDERRELLELEPGDAVPAPDSIEPEPELESVERWTLPELEALAGTLEEFGRYLSAELADFPHKVAWHCGANVYEPELLRYEELVRELAEDERRRLAREELVRAAGAMLESVERVGELAKVEPGAADAFADLEPAASVLRLALEGL